MFRTLCLAVFFGFVASSSAWADEQWHHYRLSSMMRAAFQTVLLPGPDGGEGSVLAAQPLYFDAFALDEKCGYVELQSKLGAAEIKNVIRLQWNEKERYCYGKYSFGPDDRLYLRIGKTVLTQEIKLVAADRREWSYRVRLADAVK